MMGVVHMDSFEAKKAYLAIYFHTKELFFGRVVNGDICP
jgi:hypothetical protein